MRAQRLPEGTAQARSAASSWGVGQTATMNTANRGERPPLKAVSSSRACEYAWEHTARHAPKVAVEDMRRVDVVVCGSVAVNRRGSRLGKGAGYCDIAVALLQEAGRIGPSTVIVTTVHPLQVIDDAVPETEHDFSVDLIVTPDEVIECEPQRHPTGLYWNNLTAAKIAAISVLAARRR